MPVMDANIWTLFAAVADAGQDRPALTWRERALTYGGLQDRAMRLANVLAGAGLGTRRPRADLAPWESGQDLVALYLYNGPEYLEASLGGYAARVAPFNVNYRYVAAELTALFEDASPAAIIYHECFAPTLAQVLSGMARRPFLLQVADGSGAGLLQGAIDYETALASASPELGTTGHCPDDLYVLYTGGTTGAPKATLWRQADIYAAALSIGIDTDQATPDDIVQAAVATSGPRVLPNAPFMHGAAHWLALGALLAGGCVTINGVVDHLDAADAWSTVERHRSDTALVVGEAFARPLLDELERAHYDTSSLGLVLVGGAFTSAATKQRLLRLLPHVAVADLAGASETGSALQQIATAGQAIDDGIFMPGPTVGVLDSPLTTRLPAGHAGIGWLAKSGHIPLGYLGDAEKTQATFPEVDGVRWSVPGDRVRLRADATIELLGRDAQTINSGGEKIFAEEVEQALLAHASVVDAVVVGRAHERWGEEVVAIVQLDQSASVDNDDLIEAAASRLARYKLPKAIIIVPTVRRSPAGKADYRWARAAAEERRPSSTG
jgi:fatty-acyl-CoA synthase